MSDNTPKLELKMALQLVTQSTQHVTIPAGEAPVLDLRFPDCALMTVNFLRSGSQAVQVVHELHTGYRDNSEDYLTHLQRLLRALQRPGEKFTVTHTRELDEGQAKDSENCTNVNVFTVKRTLKEK